MPAQIWGVDILVWIACAYALLLVACGWGFDVMARRTAARSVANRTFGFEYHESHDAWLCPEDQWLWPTAYDRDNRVMRYRGKPDICNTCPIKDTCTVSDLGREITREIDPWPYNESGRYHRGIAVAVAFFSLVILVACGYLRHTVADVAVLAVAAVACIALSVPLALDLLKSPAVEFGEPAHVRHVSAEESMRTKADCFAQKWGGVSNERTARRDAAVERELLPVVSVTNSKRRKNVQDDADPLNGVGIGKRRGWSGAKEAPLHRTTAEALERMNLERSQSGSGEQ